MRMPRYALDILGMLHHHGYALEIRIGLDWGRVSSPSS